MAAGRGGAAAMTRILRRGGPRRGYSAEAGHDADIPRRRPGPLRDGNRRGRGTKFAVHDALKHRELLRVRELPRVARAEPQPLAQREAVLALARPVQIKVQHLEAPPFVARHRALDRDEVPDVVRGRDDRRTCEVIPRWESAEAGRGGAAAATWIVPWRLVEISARPPGTRLFELRDEVADLAHVLGLRAYGYAADGSRRRRGCDVDVLRRRVAATPRLGRGWSVETSRGDEGSRRRRGVERRDPRLATPPRLGRRVASKGRGARASESGSKSFSVTAVHPSVPGSGQYVRNRTKLGLTRDTSAAVSRTCSAERSRPPRPGMT